MDPQLRQVAQWLDDAAAPVKVLQWLAWPRSVRQRFFARGERELPQVTYPPFDAAPTLERVERARRVLGPPEDPVEQWLARHADAIETGARMLAAAGTPAFLRHATALYGRPAAPGGSSALTERARAVRRWADALTSGAAGTDDECPLEADTVAEILRHHIAQGFGDAGPGVAVVDDLAAKVLAGADTVRIRRGTRFGERELGQLVEHEVYVHVLTTLNARRQSAPALLTRPQPRTTATQEGLAVLAEWMSGHIDAPRVARLANRVIAVHAALEGADFIEVYRLFLERCGDRDQAFDDAHRIFRGGCPAGGVAFTKDMVYLDGLTRVTELIRAAAQAGRTDLLPLLFLGKLDVADIGAAAQLVAAGDCSAPAFQPAWARDPASLLGQLSCATFVPGYADAAASSDLAAKVAAAPRWAPDRG